MLQGPAAVGLVGRERELAVLDDLLGRDGPGVLVVASPVGMGKTTLLEALRARAEAAQRQVLPGPGEGPLVRPEDTPGSFAERLGGRLDKLIPVPSGAPAGDSSAKAAARTVEAHPQDPEALAAKLGRAAGIVSLLLVADDYWPTPDLAGWFTDRFFPALLSGKGSVLVAVGASRQADVEALSRRATEVLELRPLSTATVAEHFRGIGRRLQPPLADAELDAYTAAACEQPQLLGPLTRALLLASPPGSTGAAP